MIKKILGLSDKPNHFLWFYGIIILVCSSQMIMPLAMSVIGKWNDATGRSLRFVENYRSQEKPNILNWGENIPANDGFGFDGVLYAKLCREFPGILWDHNNVNSKKRRFVPSVVAWSVIKVTPLSFSEPAHIVLAFRIVAFMSLLLSVFVFIKICSLLKLSDITTWLAYIGLFVNYMVLKRAMYYPLDTGAVAFFCGFLFIYSYLRSSKIGLLVATIVSLYTWGVVTLFAFLLFTFPRRSKQEKWSCENNYKYFRNIFTGVVICCYLAIYLFYGVIYDEEAYFGDAPLVRSVVPLSLVLVVCYIYFGMRTILSQVRIKNWLSLFREVSIVNIVIFFIVIFLYKLSIRNMDLLSTQILDKLHSYSLRPMTQPAVFYVAHVIFFGPVIALVVLLWREIVAAAREIGLGLLLSIAIAFALSLNSESRHLTLAIVPIIFLVARVLEKYKITKEECVLFGVVSLLYSKVWMLMNIGNVEPANVLVMPWQRYFMSCGPWMSNRMYVLQGVIVAVTTIVLWTWIQKKKQFTTKSTKNT